MEKKVKSCSVCEHYQKTNVAVDGVDFNACGLRGWLINVELAKEQALCQE